MADDVFYKVKQLEQLERKHKYGIARFNLPEEFCDIPPCDKYFGIRSHA